jgi:hypothetical protein
MVTVSIHQPEFLPWLGLIDKLRQSEVAVLLDSVQFRKNYFQNRNRIRSATGTAWLSVPVLTSGRSEQTIREVRICNQRQWRRKHQQTLNQHYAHAPFFEEHFETLQALYQGAGDSLADLNQAIIEWMARSFSVSCRFVRSSDLRLTGQRTDLLLAICRTVGADVYLSGPSGKEYLDETRFVAAGIQVRYHQFSHPVFRQCYEPFVPMLSAVDLLFNHGPESRRILSAEGGSRLPLLG